MMKAGALVRGSALSGEKTMIKSGAPAGRLEQGEEA
jgi:hypothetical protein